MNAETVNGSAPKAKVATPLDELHKQFVDSGKTPSDKEVKALVAGLKAAVSGKKEAEEAYKEACAKESNAVRALVVACGKGKFQIPGDPNTYTPMALRSDDGSVTCYLKPESKGAVRKLGG